MAINSRTKGANFEREIGNLLVEQLGLTQPVKRILEQTRTRELPDLKLGRWCLECKRYGDGSEPSPYLLHSKHHLPNLRSGNSFVRVCSRILFTGCVKPNCSTRRLPISLSKLAPFVLELIATIIPPH